MIEDVGEQLSRIKKLMRWGGKVLLWVVCILAAYVMGHHDGKGAAFDRLMEILEPRTKGDAA